MDGTEETKVDPSMEILITLSPSMDHYFCLHQWMGRRSLDQNVTVVDEVEESRGATARQQMYVSIFRAVDGQRMHECKLASIDGNTDTFFFLENGMTDVPDAHRETHEIGMSFQMGGSGF
jgi:hypothetical protein